MENLSFKYGNLSDIPDSPKSGTVYFSRDDNNRHSLRGYLIYDMIAEMGEDVERIPICGSGYYIAPDRKLSNLESMFVENNLFSISNGATIGVGGENPGELWLHKSNKGNTTTDRGLWSPLFIQVSDQKTDNGKWIIKAGNDDPDAPNENKEYLYLGSPNYLETNAQNNPIIKNTYTIRPMDKDLYNLGDNLYKWKNLYVNTVNASGKLKVEKNINDNNIAINTITVDTNAESPCATFEIEHIEKNNDSQISKILKFLLISAGENSTLSPYYKDGETEILNQVSLGSQSRKWKNIYIHDTVYSDKILIESSSNILGTLTVAGTTSLQDTLTVVGKSNLDGGLSSTSGTFSSTLEVGGRTELLSSLIVKGIAFLQNSLNVVGSTVLQDTLKVSKATALQDILTVNGATALQDTLITDGATFLRDALTVDGATSLKDTLTVDGTTYLSDTLSVAKKASLDGGLETTFGLLSSTLEVAGATVLKDTLTVDKETILKDALNVEKVTTLKDALIVNGFTKINNNLEVTGTTTVTNKAYLNGGVETTSGKFTSTLTVEGTTSLQNTLTVAGKSNLDGGLKATSGSFTSTLNVSGAASLKDTLNVVGVTTLQNKLNVVKATHLQDTLIVDKETTLKDTLTLTNKAYLNGGLETTSGKLTSTLTVEGAASLQDTLTVVKKSNLDGGLSTTSGTFSSTLNVTGKLTAKGGVDITSASTYVRDETIIWGPSSEKNGTSLVYGDSGPKLIFSSRKDQSDIDNQKIQLIYTNAGTGASLALVSNVAAYFVAPKFIGPLTGDVTGNLTGNASTATKLKTARTFSVGDQSGSFDGSKNLSLAITAAMSCTNGTSGSPQLGITVNGVSSSKVTIPTASKKAYGVVTTGEQTFAGKKIFGDGLSSTTGSFSSTVSVSGKLTASGGLSSTTGSFSSTVSVSGKLTASGGLQVYGLTDVDPSKESGRLRIGEDWKDMLLMDTNEIVHIERANSKDTTPSIGKLFITSKGGLDGGFIKFINPNSIKTTVTYQGGHLTADSKDKYGACINVQWTQGSDTRANYSAMLIRQSDEKAAWCATHKGLDTGDTHVYLGTKDRLWSTVYAKNGQISSSDVRLKDIQDQSYLEKALEMYDNLTPISFKWKNLSKNSNYDRIHIGLQAQQVEELLNSSNLKATDMSLLCIDSINLDEMPGYKNVITDGKVYSLRYSEFHGLHILKNQQQDARLTELETKNKELENTISTLKTQVELLKLAIGG